MFFLSTLCVFCMWPPRGQLKLLFCKTQLVWGQWLAKPLEFLDFLWVKLLFVYLGIEWWCYALTSALSAYQVRRELAHRSLSGLPLTGEVSEHAFFLVANKCGCTPCSLRVHCDKKRCILSSFLQKLASHCNTAIWLWDKDAWSFF